MHQSILKPIININPDTCNTYHDAQGRVVYISSNLEDLLGLQLTGWSGQQILDRIYPIDKRHLITWWIRNLRGDISAEPSIIFRFRGDDGTYIWLETNIEVLDPNFNGQPQAFLTTIMVLDQYISYYLQTVFHAQLAKTEMQTRLDAIYEHANHLAGEIPHQGLIKLQHQLDDLKALYNDQLRVSSTVEDADPDLEEINVVLEFGKIVSALDILYPDSIDPAISYKGVAGYAMGDPVKLEIVLDKLYSTIIEASNGIAKPEFTLCFFRQQVALAIMVPGIMKPPAFLDELLVANGMIKQYIRAMEGDVFTFVMPHIGYQVIIVLELVPPTIYIL
ncbi:PAS domain-containing protein [Flavihumibacter sp. ZG627]|uniref:PAS domain-containing protein n=1 Tax=Flavihumibacter sp. ZG627 TaxID=1463156 RepID=UPI00057D864F|nr:PAS domain-containing protein [Flavihumibacter sp. ZG627]KIC92281.1 hypothetical protein HY58_01660 [Flavihumibacter sp. ZG627]